MSHVLICSISFDRERGGGAIRLAYDIAQGLVREGHRVTVVCEDRYGHGSGVGIENGMTVLRYRLPASRAIAPRRHAEHLAAASELLLEQLPEPPDVVHGHGLLQYVAALRLYRGQARCCYSIHSPAVDELRIAWGGAGPSAKLKRLLGLPIIRRLEAECLRDSDALTAESAYTREVIREQYGVAIAERIEVVPGWVDLVRFRPLPAAEVAAARLRLGWPADRPVLFALRRLEARMGLDNLLRALRIVRDRGYGLFTVIGGSGSQLLRLQRLRAELGLEREVVFPGFVSGEDLPFAYAACDASMVPTAQLECFGLIALEALACGRPALVTPVGALPEVVGGFEPRWIARGSTPEELAELLCEFLDGALPSHSAETLRARLEARFSFAQVFAEHLAVLFPRVASPI